MEHTPGPWRFTGTSVHSESTKTPICALSPQRNSQADGWLIAAAPDLLDVLKTLLAVATHTQRGSYDPPYVDSELEERVLAVIAKAEGQ